MMDPTLPNPDAQTPVRQSATVTILLLLLLNLLLSALWPILNNQYSIQNLVLGFLGGLLLISLAERNYGRLVLYSADFVLYTLWQILLSNLKMARLLLRNEEIYPGIVDVPLRLSTDFEIVLLASVITLTPGTLSVDLGRNPSGQRVLYVHNLKVEDREAFQQSIQEGFEYRILRLTRGAA